MNKVQKTPAVFDSPTVLLEEFVAVDDNNVCTATKADKGTLEFDKKSKNIIDADSDDEKEVNNAASSLFLRHPK
ncbi:hypothetical protein TNCV_4096581 [Trichonephila clavipes]|nr:hypothetical protein TNCV_4096581 [Trichonephila clavipes]